jgi:hypothetical protein
MLTFDVAICGVVWYGMVWYAPASATRLWGKVSEVIVDNLNLSIMTMGSCCVCFAGCFIIFCQVASFVGTYLSGLTTMPNQSFHSVVYSQILITGSRYPENLDIRTDIFSDIEYQSQVFLYYHATYLGGPYRVAVCGHLVSIYGPVIEYM